MCNTFGPSGRRSLVVSAGCRVPSVDIAENELICSKVREMQFSSLGAKIDTCNAVV